MPPNEKETHLRELGFFGNFLNGIAAIAKDALFPIDLGDRAGARASVGKRRVERDEARLAPQLSDINTFLAF